jgi:predicted enzyme related to lactoylglutathione lyase
VCQGQPVILKLTKRQRRPIDTQLSIEVADFAYEYQRLVAEGVKFCALPQERADGGWNARICDPDGNVIGIIEKLNENSNGV